MRIEYSRGLCLRNVNILHGFLDYAERYRVCNDCSWLTSRGDQTDNNGGGSAGTLDQDSDQYSDHQSRHRVRKHFVVFEYVPCNFTYPKIQHIPIKAFFFFFLSEDVILRLVVSGHKVTSFSHFILKYGVYNIVTISVNSGKCKTKRC